MFNSIRNAIYDRTNRTRDEQERGREDKQDFVLFEHPDLQRHDSVAPKPILGADTRDDDASTQGRSSLGLSLSSAGSSYRNGCGLGWAPVQCGFPGPNEDYSFESLSYHLRVLMCQTTNLAINADASVTKAM